MQSSGRRGRELVEDAQRVERRRVDHRPRREDLVPALDLRFDLLAPGAVLLALQLRDQLAQRVARVADQADLHRVADADQAAVDVDLHAARLARLGQPLRVGEARADHQEGVAAVHHLVARLRAEQADRAGHVRQVVGKDVAAVERLGDPCAEQFGDLLDLLRGLAGAGADEDRDLLAAVQQLGGAAHLLGRRDHARGLGVGGPGEDRAVAHRRVFVGGLLHVLGEDQRGDRARGAGDLHSAVDQMARLRRRHAGLDELRGDVLEQRVEVDLLLVVRPQRGRLLLADQRDDRLVVELRVVEAVEQVNRPGPRGRHADADLAGQLGVRAGGEGGDLLVARLHELDLLTVLVKAPQNAVDAIAGIAVDPAHPMLVKSSQYECSNGFRHRSSSLRSSLSVSGGLPVSAAGKRPWSRFGAHSGQNLDRDCRPAQPEA